MSNINRKRDMTPDFLGSTEFLLLIPKNDRHGIVGGSGIVAKALGSEFQIDYEGNLYGAINLMSYGQRVINAADRGTTNYPPVARLWFTKEQMLQDFEIAGTFDFETLKARLQTRGWTGDSSAEDEALQKSADIYPEQKDKLKTWANNPPV